MKTIIFTCILAVLGGMAFAETPDDPKFSVDAENSAKNFHERIEAEISVLGDHLWAAQYYYGDGLGANVSLAIAPKSGFVFEWHGCLGLYDRNYGSVEFANGVIRLLFTFENKREAFQGIEEELIPVSWDSRRYLIPPEYMIEFCNDVNAGWEPRERLHGNYLLRVGDEKTEVSGFPTVPYEYRSYLITRPIEVEIITVGTSRTHSGIFRFKETQVTLNAGETQGLLVGMELYVFEPDRIAESVEVVKVWDETSEGIMTQTLIGETAPQVGWKLSTRLSWKREKKGDGSQADTADTK